MRVLQINAVYNQLSTGRTTTELHNALLENGIDSFCAFAQSNVEGGENLYRIGTPFDRKLHAFLSRLSGKQAYFSKGATKKLIKYMDEIKPDIVHLRNFHSNYINMPMILDYLGKNDIATVVTLHDFFFLTGKCVYFTEADCSKWQTKCENCPNLKNGNPTWFFDRTADMFRDKYELFSKIKKLAFVGVSDWAADEAKKSPIAANATEVKRIYNWIDLDRFRPLDVEAEKKRLGLEDDFVILGVAAVWDERKGISDFIRLAKSLSEYNDVKVVLIGPVPRVSLDDGEDGLEYVIPVGSTDSVDELVSYYNAADVLVTLSTEETFGKVSAEALSCGTPVVCYNATANPELVGEGCGYVVEKGDLDGVKNAILKIKEDTKADYSQNCIGFSHKNFDKDECIKQYILLYRQLLGE